MIQQPRFLRRGLMCAAGLTGLTAGLSLVTQAEAQVVERNLPSTPRTDTPPIAAPNAVPKDQDATPIGPALRAIVLIGPKEDVHATAEDGIEASGVARLAADKAAVQARLAPYLGKPLSRKLIAEIEASVAEHYRALNYPFVSLSTPPQEIGAGVLQIRVVEFVAGDIKTEGASPQAQEQILKRIKLKPSEPINARTLSYDISWLNRYPFRQVQAVFKPGSTTASSDLVLQTYEGKPWQFYTGYNNTGSPATGRSRYYFGGAVGFKRDQVLSYQVTGSDKMASSSPKYFSYALNYAAPVGYHKRVEASFNSVRSNQTLAPFTVRQTTYEGTLGYRFGVSDLYNDRALTDMRFGIEAKRQLAKTYFGGAQVYDAAMNVYQLYLGYHRNAEAPRSRSDLDFTLHLSPGGLNGGNESTAVQQYSQGRLKDAKYAYLSLTYDRQALLGKHLTWKMQVVGQTTTGALPRTEQMGLGGAYLVRGYSLDDGAVDEAIVVRNELHANPWVSSKVDNFTIRPYAFIDIGKGSDKYLSKSSNLMATGLGSSVRLGKHSSLNLEGAYALRKGVATRSGDWRSNVSLNFVF